MTAKKKIRASERKSLKHRGTKCLNCGQPLDRSDVYCPYCSQLNSNKHLSAKDFFAEFLGSIIVYDSRMRNTIRDLLFHPGKMTENYIKGQRMKYANPFRFFLSVSIIYILFQSIVGFIYPTYDSESPGLELTSAKNDSIQKYINAERQKHPDEKELKKLSSYFKAKRSTDSLADIASILNVDNTKSTSYYNFRNSAFYYSEKTLDTLSNFEGYTKRMTLYWEFYSRNKILDPRTALDSLNHTNTMRNRWSYSRAIAGNKIVDEPDAFLDYIMAKVPFFLFFFSPIYALFFKLFYPKRFNYMDHLIFVFHIFSFVFLAMLLLEIPDLIFDTEFFNILLFSLIGPLYFYLALRNFYKQSKLLSFFKFGLLSVVYGICLLVSATMFVALSAAIY